jgi:hypothetical protein
VWTWPLEQLEPGERVVFGGCPSAYRRSEGKDLFNVSFACFVGVSREVSDTKLSFALSPYEALSPQIDCLPHADLGGCSGGPVFRLIDCRVPGGGRLFQFDLVGTISEHLPEYGLLSAHPLTALRPDGRFDE